MTITSFLFFVTCMVFYYWHNTIGIIVVLSLSSALNYAQNISLNCCVLLVPSNAKMFFWLSICHGCYGVGSLIAPLVVDLLVMKSYFVSGGLMLILVPLYAFYLNDPRKVKEERLKS